MHVCAVRLYSIAGLFMVLVLCHPAGAGRIENKVAVFSALDKVTASIKKLEVPLGETVEFGALRVTRRVCATRGRPPSNPRPHPLSKSRRRCSTEPASVCFRAGCLPRARASMPSNILSSTFGLRVAKSLRMRLRARRRRAAILMPRTVRARRRLPRPGGASDDNRIWRIFPANDGHHAPAQGVRLMLLWRRF